MAGKLIRLMDYWLPDEKNPSWNVNIRQFEIAVYCQITVIIHVSGEFQIKNKSVFQELFFERSVSVLYQNAVSSI